MLSQTRTLAKIAPAGETHDVTSHAANNTKYDSEVNYQTCR
jgi:hypothetical protein